MSEKLYDLKWLGDDVIKVSEEQLKTIMEEFALTAEGESKKELKKTGGTAKVRYVGGKKTIINSHGVVTGTLRRSIHAARHGYNFSSDNVIPSESSPERGGKVVSASEVREGTYAVDLGSGLVYAMSIHQGWGSFEGYHYLTKGVEKAREKIATIINRHKVS